MIENLVFITCQPNKFKYTWELEIQISNFRKFGISSQMQVLVWFRKGESISIWASLQAKYPEIKVFLYEDQGADITFYEPVIRPHILKQHFKVHEESLKGKNIFYCDSDIIFTRLPDFQKLMSDDIIWESDTSGYLDYNYLRSVENRVGIEPESVIKGMADLGGITVDIIKSYTGKTGGAQYLLKNIDYSFWEEVEVLCKKIRNYLFFDAGGINSKYFGGENDGFQSWCADMWAVNFILWKRGLVTDVTPELEFSWATDHADNYYKKPIYHNAGATHLSQGLFFKAASDWETRSPIGQNISVSKNFCNYYYVEAMKEVK